MRTCHHYANLKRENGFSLIELLIVVAIILIIAAIAIPDLLKSKRAAQQASAVASLRTINSSEVTYASTYNTGYSFTLAALDGTGIASINNAELIDDVLGTGHKSGYDFFYVACPAAPGKNDAGIGMANGCVAPAVAATYQVSGNPVGGVGTGGNFYYTDASGVIRQENNALADQSSVPLAG